MARRSVLVALLATGAAQAATRQNVLEFVHEKLAADPAVDAARRQALEAAITERFAGYGNNVVRPSKPEDVRTLMHVINEGILDEQSPERIADVGFAAYQAIWRGAPAEAVDGIALYGFQKPIPADTIAAWANGYREGVQGGVPGDVMAALIHGAMKHDWPDSTFNTAKWALVSAARHGWDTRVYAAHALARLEKDPEHPGRIQSDLQAAFDRAARKKETPAPPKGYEAEFPTDGRVGEAEVAPTGEQKAAEPAPGEQKTVEHEVLEQKTGPAEKRTHVEKKAGPDDRKKATGPKRTVALPDVWPTLEQTARSYVGTPYVWGGVTHKGIDCSGFTMSSYREGAKLGLPRVSKQQWETGTPVSKDALREGDLVFFDTAGNGVSHVGMIVDAPRQKLIHASSSKGVVEADLGNKWFQSRYLGARRVTR